MKKTFRTLCMAALLVLLPTAALADSAPGDMIISLGKNLTEQQRSQILQEMQATDDAIIIEVTNAEEHEALGNYIPKAQIGTRSLSSAAITIGEKDSGIIVETKNINWVSNEMYINALSTAGVKDAKVYITSPFSVSGTAALTGVIKAYEVSTGEEIPEEQKQVANEEMVTTAELGEAVGKEEASALMTAIKDEIANDMPKNADEMQQVIEAKAEELNIPIDEAQTEKLTELFENMKAIDIDWNAVGEQAAEAKQKLENFINSEEAQNFFESAGQFIKDVFQAIVDFFSNLFGNKEEA